MPYLDNVSYKNPIINNIEVVTEKGKYQLVEQWFAGVVPETVTLNKHRRVKGLERVTGFYKIKNLDQYAIEEKNSICEGALFVDASKCCVIKAASMPTLDLKLSNNRMRDCLSFKMYKADPKKMLSLVSLNIWYEQMKLHMQGVRFGRFINNKLVWE